MFGWKMQLPIIDKEPVQGHLQLIITLEGRRSLAENAFYGPDSITPLLSTMLLSSFQQVPLSSFFSERTTFYDLTASEFPGCGDVHPDWFPQEPLPGFARSIIGTTPPLLVSGDPAGEAISGFYLWDLSSNVLIAGVSLDKPVILVSGMLLPRRVAVT